MQSKQFLQVQLQKNHLQCIYCCYIKWCFLSLSLYAVLELWGWWNHVNVVQQVTELTVSSIILAACSDSQEISLLSPIILCTALFSALFSTNEMQGSLGGHWHIHHVTGHSGCHCRRVTDLWATAVEILCITFSQCLFVCRLHTKWLL